MLRRRWLVIAALLAVGILGSAINARGPFESDPPLSYSQFLADLEAGRVEWIAQWRDRLEVTEGSARFVVIVPGDTDLAFDLGQARVRGGVGISLSRVPDNWLGFDAPWVPALVFAAGLYVWLPAVVRGGPQNRIPPVEPALP